MSVVKYPMRDMIVVLPGITGSVLHEGTDPLWGLSSGALWEFVKHRGANLQRLAVTRHDPRGEPPESQVRATGLVDGFHGIFGVAKVDGYKQLIGALGQRFDVVLGQWYEDTPANLVVFPYDWRLSNRASAQRLAYGLERKLAAWRAHTGNPGAKVILVAHSMGGLVSRYWIEVLEGWRECRALVTFGTPYRGSVDALGYIANGYKKAFVDLTKVLLSCPSIYELLPIYPAIQSGDTWYRPHEIDLPVFDRAMAGLARDYAAAAAEFHRDIREAVANNSEDPDYLRACTVVPYVGVHQTTDQSAMLEAGKLVLSTRMPTWIEDDVSGGDGTVPRVSAIPIEMESSFASTFMGARHGGLQNVASGLDDLVERLRQSQSRHMQSIQGSVSPPQRAVDVLVDDLYLPEEDVVIRGRTVDADDNPTGEPLRAVIEPDLGGPPLVLDLKQGAAYDEATAPQLAAGRYRVTLELTDHTAAMAQPVRDVFEVSG